MRKWCCYILLLAVLFALPSCSMRTYLSTDFLPVLADETTGQQVLLSATVTETESGKSVMLTESDLSGLLLNLENMECTRGKTDSGEPVLYRVSFTLAGGEAEEWLIYNKVAFSVGGYRYSSIRGSVDLYWFAQLFQ